MQKILALTKKMGLDQGGLWLSEDGGKTWTEQTGQLNSEHSKTFIRDRSLNRILMYLETVQMLLNKAELSSAEDSGIYSIIQQCNMDLHPQRASRQTYGFTSHHYCHLIPSVWKTLEPHIIDISHTCLLQ
jgi:hypothetical protein